MAIAIKGTHSTRRPTTLVRGLLLGASGIVVGSLLAALLLAAIATRFFDFSLLTVRSGSMAPAINSGDLIVVKPVAIADLSAGDVILFDSGGDAIPTVHRVAGVNTVEIQVRDASGAVSQTLTEHRLVTRGDANPLPDASDVRAADLRGEVWFNVPHGGAIAGLPLQMLLLAVACVVTTVWLAWELNRKRGRV